MGITASSAGENVGEGQQIPDDRGEASSSSRPLHCLSLASDEKVEQPPVSSAPLYPFLSNERRGSKTSEARQASRNSTSRSSTSRSSIRTSKAASGQSGKKTQKYVPATWSRRDPAERIFAVVRHGERADVLGSQMDGKPWTLTEESMRFPIDPPLSDVGRVEVVRAATIVKDFADRSHSQLHIVVSSLFLRCVQTAVEVCKKLGPGTKLMLDNALGEVYGPCVLGDIKPMTACHTFRYLARYVRSQGVKIVKKPCGSAPEWPESLRKARERYATAFLTYIRRAEISRRNFVIVSHADCIASILALVPGKAGRMVESVSYAATVLGKLCSAKRRTDGDETTASFDSTATDSNRGPGAVDRAPSEKMQWEVEIDRITMGPRWRGGASRAAKSAIANMSASKVELLGGLSEEPLGDVTPQSLSDTSAFSEEGTRSQKEPRESDDLDLVSSCSSSTYLYGASDTEPDCGSPDNGRSFESVPSVPSNSEVKERPSNISPGTSSMPKESATVQPATARSRISSDSATSKARREDSSQGSNVRTASAGKVKLQGCGGSAIMARRAQRAGPG